MGNKYGSNIRTYTARNLVWDVSGTQPVPLTMNAPNAFTVQASGMVPVFYKAQFPHEDDWNSNSKVSVKRAGIFCNFADGLVQKMDTSRVTMTITVSLCTPNIIDDEDTAVFTAGSNVVTGVGSDLTPFLPGMIIYDNFFNYPYYVQKRAAGAGLPCYITDYARATSSITGLVSYDRTFTKDFTIYNLATLNTMYEAEIFFPYCPVTQDQRMFISCQLGIDGVDTSLDFYTKSIDPLFNGSPVSFDSVIELEITPTTPIPS